MKVTPLQWDTDLFGYPVGSIESSVSDWSDRQLATVAATFRLVYVFSDEPLISNVLTAGDIKCIFSKKVDTTVLPQGVIPASNSTGYKDTLTILGRQSGLYSRFALDPNFQHGEFDKLYDRWVENSLSGNIAYDVLVVEDNDDPIGMITVGEKGPTGSAIGLFAVKEGFRGHGIGLRLIAAAEHAAFQHGHRTLSVATQGSNTGACGSYLKAGFELTSEKYIYHYWNERYSVQ